MHSRNLTSIEERDAELASREFEVKRIKQKSIHTMAVINGEAENNAGCASATCSLLLTRLPRWLISRWSMHAAERSSHKVDVNAAIFGARRSPLAATDGTRAANRLHVASDAITTRLEEVEMRISLHRAEAVRLAKEGSRDKALRSLRRAKQIEAQRVSLQATADAVAMQADALEDATLQTQVALALKASVGSAAASTKAVRRVEKAADEAIELRDAEEDMRAAMTQLAEASSAPVDDDELEAELLALSESPPTQSVQAAQPQAPTTPLSFPSAIVAPIPARASLTEAPPTEGRRAAVELA